MSATPSPDIYPRAMRALHWATALLMAAVVVLAWVLPEHAGSDSTLLMLHKAVGITILALTALRLVVRNTSRLPADSDAVSRLEALAARATHVVLYGILLAMPVSGYLTAAARGRATSMFGLFDIPALVPQSAALHDAAWAVHGFGQMAVYWVIGIHAAASLFHLVVRRDGVMDRMWPGLRRQAARFMPAASALPGAR